VIVTDHRSSPAGTSMLYSSAFLVASASAFSPLPACRPAAPVVRAAACMSSEEPLISAETSRRAVLAGLLGMGVGAGATPAFAGYVTSLGIEPTKPTDADRDDEVLATKAVQDGLKNLRSYKASASSLKATFDKDTTIQLIPSIRKDFDFSQLRTDLNTVATVFDDTTQLTTDRLARAILYDLTELENASRLKKGEDAARTPKKIANVQKWFAKLDSDFDAFLAYF